MTPNELLADIEKMGFDYFMQEALQRVPTGIDTREGSIIYDALAPASYNFAEIALQLHTILLETYTQTATGEFLDYRAAEKGIKRNPATFTEVKGKFTTPDGSNFDVELGTRFASVGVEPIYYKVNKRISEGVFTLNAEQSGNNANRYVGQILPVDNMNGLGYAEITSVEIPARDEETDDELRERLLSANDFIQYGGNVADYIDIMKNLDDVGAGQVYPTWDGGGTVRLVILNNEFLIPTQALIDEVQDAIDPRDNRGNGYGIAPIGHLVTVAAPTPKTVNFDVGLDTNSNLTYVDVKPGVELAIKSYFNLLRREQWAELKGARHYSLTIYRSQLIAEILKVDGVVNVSTLNMNGSTNDINLVFDNKLQELPIVGEVVVHG